MKEKVCGCAFFYFLYTWVLLLQSCFCLYLHHHQVVAVVFAAAAAAFFFSPNVAFIVSPGDGGAGSESSCFFRKKKTLSIINLQVVFRFFRILISCLFVFLSAFFAPKECLFACPVCVSLAS